MKSLTIDNCIVTLNSTQNNATNGAVFSMNKGDGFVNTLIIQNSTFSGNGKAKYFVQYGNSGRADRGGYTSNLFAYRNSTFYKINNGQLGNYGGMKGKKTSYWELLSCIFVDCGNGAVSRYFLGGQGNQSTATFAYNTYWFKGASETGYETYDNSGTVLTTDPALTNPDNGDFTPTGADQLSNKTGDPRWLPATE